MGKFFSTLNAAGMITVAVMIGLVFAVSKLVPTGPEHDLLIGVISALGAQTITSTRTPSDQGGTTKTAPPSP